MLESSPRFTTELAERLAHTHYGLEGNAHPLPSERDQNFLLLGGAGDRFVLKIANGRESPEMLDAQQAVLAHLALAGFPAPRVVRAVTGAPRAEVAGPDGRRHAIWAIDYLAGVPLAAVRHRPAPLLRDFGARIGELARALSSFDHPALHRDFHWDLVHARRVIAERRSAIDDHALGEAIDTIVARAEPCLAPLLPRLRWSTIHGDLNDHNVLVGDAAVTDRGAVLGGGQRSDDWCGRLGCISGIVDFGDMVHSWTVADLAIAAAYVAIEAADPLGAAAHVVRGYHAEHPLEDAEIGALFGLMALRLCVSACMAAAQRMRRPDNEYLTVSQPAIQRTLPLLARIPFGLAEAVFREACGMEPVRTSGRVREWLASRTGTFAPIIADADLRTEPSLVLDLSVGSPLIAGDPASNAEPQLTPRIVAAMTEAGVRVGVGRWDEPRLLYTADFFARPDAPAAELRTLHIGLDLFAPAGTPVHAPLEGVVHAFASNDVPQDYGPVIILRHECDDGTPFFTLYGHLSRDSLATLHPGSKVARGERLATLGAPDENVGWTPHLHLQLITDLLDLGTDFPGVAPSSQRAVWRSLSPDPNLLVGIPASRFPAPAPSLPKQLARRTERLGANLSLAYREPLRAARGWMQWLFDDAGRRYVDAYNNVPHVGHCHPRVVAAGQAQMAVLSTNTRYASDLLPEYAERLAALFPPPLSVVYVVNSASEANELALRMARAHTGRRDTVVLEAAYHGNTTTLIDVSPYKHAGPGGTGAPDWVHVAPLPDTYRGRYRRDDPDAGAKYARHVQEIIERLGTRGRAPAAFLAETCPSVGGQVILPDGYLRSVYATIREAGGLCIADEVQTGLGRLGTHLWAFEAQDVVPDIVVLGTPVGNGHPIGAVVTTREIADSFANGMEFFSTFGGNTVSCAIGLAVLDVLRDEGLQAHADRVGREMLAALRPLCERYPIVGDVRGSGLFLGVELVRDRGTLEPAGAEAAYLADRMREEGILLGTDGPDHNVIKIRPPMPFATADGDRLVEVLERIVADELRPGLGRSPA